MQQVNVLHVYPGVVSSVAVSVSSLLQQKLQEIIEKGGHRIISVVPCVTSTDLRHDFVVITEREQQ